MNVACMQVCDSKLELEAVKIHINTVQNLSCVEHSECISSMVKIFDYVLKGECKVILLSCKSDKKSCLSHFVYRGTFF